MGRFVWRARGEAGPLEFKHALQTPAQEKAQSFAVHSSAIDKTKLKTKMCRHWLTGARCPYGERCAYAHGEGERVASQHEKQQQQQHHAHHHGVGSTPITMPLQLKDAAATGTGGAPAHHARNGVPHTPTSLPMSSWAAYPPSQASYAQNAGGYDSAATTPFATGFDTESYATNSSFVLDPSGSMCGRSASMTGSMFDAAPPTSAAGSFNSSFYRYEPYGVQVTQVPVWSEAEQLTAERSGSSCGSVEASPSSSGAARTARVSAVRITAPLRLPSPAAPEGAVDDGTAGAHSPLSTSDNVMTSEDAVSNVTEDA